MPVSVSHGCFLYIVAEDPTMDRTSCMHLTRISAKLTHFMSLCSSILGYFNHFLLSPVPSLPSEGESTTGDEDEGDEPLRTDKPGKANRCTSVECQYFTVWLSDVQSALSLNLKAVAVISCYLLPNQPMPPPTHTCISAYGCPRPPPFAHPLYITCTHAQ